MEAPLDSKRLKVVTTYRRQPPRLVRWGFHPSPYKNLFLAVDDSGALCRVSFARGRSAVELLAACQKTWRKTEFVRDQAATAKIAAQLAKPRGTIKVTMTGTVFQQAVWQQMLKIPAGKVLSYGEVARRIKNPKAVRAVGTACGANPVAILVPCHRIVGSNGGLGGFGGGLEMKRMLLEREGVIG